MNSSRRTTAPELEGRHFFITGGTGFLGRSLLDYLRANALSGMPGFRATVLSRSPMGFLDRFPEYAGHRWLEFVEGDLENLPRLPGGCTDVMHAAADTHAGAQSACAWLGQLVEGTRRVLDLAARVRAERFLLVSSGAVYGHQAADQHAIPEDARQAPLTTDLSAVYAQGKRMAETLCALYTAHHGLPCVIARCFSILSRHVPLDGPYAAGNFLRDALSDNRDRIEVRGDGTAVRTYLDARDAAEWMFALLRRGEPGHAYNVGSDQPLSIRDLATRIADLLAPDKKIVIERKAVDSGRSVYVPDVAKAYTLGLRAKYTLNQIIVDAAAGIGRQPGESP
jgi:nucleoside-diphosphate-sugar epimerase